MSNKTKILSALLIAALILVFYLVVKSKPLSRIPEPPNEQTQKIAKVDLAELENNYKKETKIILDDYSVLISKENLKVEEVRIIRDRLLGLKVPAKLKDLHLSLVLAVAKMSESVNEADAKEEEAGAKLIQDLKAKYVWLN